MPASDTASNPSPSSRAGRRRGSRPESGADYMESSRMSFGDHLEELRRCLIRSLLGVGVCAAVCLAVAGPIVLFLCQPLFAAQQLHDLPLELQSLSPQAGFMVHMKVAILSGVIIAMPWVIYQVWTFVASGLYRHEQNAAKRFVPLSAGLFALGAAFLYFIALPMVLGFFLEFNRSFGEMYGGPSSLQRLLSGAESEAPADSLEEEPGDVVSGASGSRGEELALRVPLLEADPRQPSEGDVWFNTSDGRLMVKSKEGLYFLRMEPEGGQARIASQFAIDYYVSFVLLLMLAFGLAFELPIVVWFVSAVGLVSAADLGRSRRYVILAIFIIAAVMTPPDVVSQIMLAVPMLLLFEVGLLVARMSERRRKAARATVPAA